MQSGDVLILDNATVHTGDGIIIDLYNLIQYVTLNNNILKKFTHSFRAAGVRVLFLPTYSSELDAAEHVFLFLKTYIRNSFSNEPLWKEIINGLNSITLEMMVSWYDKSIIGWANAV